MLGGFRAEILVKYTLMSGFSKSTKFNRMFQLRFSSVFMNLKPPEIHQPEPIFEPCFIKLNGLLNCFSILRRETLHAVDQNMLLFISHYIYKKLAQLFGL